MAASSIDKEDIIWLAIRINTPPPVIIHKCDASTQTEAQDNALSPPVEEPLPAVLQSPPPLPTIPRSTISKQVTFDTHTFTKTNKSYECNQCHKVLHSTKGCKCHTCPVKRYCDICCKLFPTARQYTEHLEGQTNLPIAVPKNMNEPIPFDLSPLTLTNPSSNIEAALKQLFTLDKNRCVQQKLNGMMVHVGCGTWVRKSRAEVLEWIERSLQTPT